MPRTKNSFLSTSAIAREFHIERAFLFSYLESIDLVFKNKVTNSFELTQLGLEKGAEYQSATGKAKWVIWPKKIIDDEIFNHFTMETTHQSSNQILTSVWKLDILKELNTLISDGKTIEEISLILNIDKSDIVKKIDSLPRVKKRYYLMHKNKEDEMTDNEKIISFLAQGVNPTTGEILPSDSFLNTPEIIRALFEAKEVMSQKSTKPKKEKKTIEEKQNDNMANGLPKNAGLPWTDELKKELSTEFNIHKSVIKLSELLDRKSVV